MKCIIFISSVPVPVSHRHFRRFWVSDGPLTVKKFRGPTPLPSTHPSRPSFETKKDMMKAILHEGNEPPKTHDEAKKNESHVLALQDMNFFSFAPNIQKKIIIEGRRPSSGMIFGALLLALELTGEVKKPGSRIGNTQCVHIFPHSTNMDISRSNENSAEVRTHVLLHLGHRQFLALSLTIPRPCGLL